jgi:hypothetical protein
MVRGGVTLPTGARCDTLRHMTKHRIPTTEERTLLEAEEHAFEGALGRFVMAWADAEAELYRVLKHYADVSDGVARAIFSGTRASGMIAYLRAIAHNTKLDPVRLSDLEFVFPQMATINTTRDHVVHFASQQLLIWADPTRRVLTNVERVSRYGKAVEQHIGSASLELMTQDLQVISNHLNMHWGSQAKAVTFTPWQENPGKATTWAYKPQQPKAQKARPQVDRRVDAAAEQKRTKKATRQS